jgi:hypothetical protein
VVAGTTGEGAGLASVRWSTWAQPTTVVTGTTGEGAALAYARSVGVGSAFHCGGGHNRRPLCSGLCSLRRHGLSKQLSWGTRQDDESALAMFTFRLLSYSYCGDRNDR